MFIINEVKPFPVSVSLVYGNRKRIETGRKHSVSYTNFNKYANTVHEAQESTNVVSVANM